MMTLLATQEVLELVAVSGIAIMLGGGLIPLLEWLEG